MLKNECVTKLINLEGVNFKEADIQEDTIRFFVINPHNIGVCPKCAQVSSTLVNVTPKCYKDVNLASRSCFIEVDLRRFECQTCSITFTESLSFADPYRKYTNRFEEAVYECCRETTATYTARKFGISDKTVNDIYHSKVEKRQLQSAFQAVYEIGIDEIAMHKGHQDFVLIITDLTNKRVLDVLPDKKKATLKSCVRNWDANFKSNIASVAVDLWGPYRSVIEDLLPGAVVVADRFHVMQNLNKALDTTRKKARRESDSPETWKGAKYAVLKNPENLTSEQKIILEWVLKESPNLKACYELREDFRAIFNTSTCRTSAKYNMYRWMLRIMRSEQSEYYRFLKTLLNWGDNILNYFIKGLSSGFVEGVNNKIKLIKRKAFGFQNFENFRTKIIDNFC